MAPKTFNEYIIIRFIYETDLDPKYPIVISSCREIRLASFDLYIKQWFDKVFRFENALLPVNYDNRYVEWEVMSGDPEIFYNDGVHYSKLFVVIGERTSHWMFYTTANPTRIEGKGTLPITFCSCCITDQLYNVVDAIKHKSKKKNS